MTYCHLTALLQPKQFVVGEYSDNEDLHEPHVVSLGNMRVRKGIPSSRCTSRGVCIVNLLITQNDVNCTSIFSHRHPPNVCSN